MLGWESTLSWAVDEARWLMYVRGVMFAWNLGLAFVPVALAAVLFRSGARRGPIWWAGVVAFVLFLPNAAYVLTDVVHLFDDVRGGATDLALMTVYGPVYGVFFALGLACYVVSLILLQDHLAEIVPRVPWRPVEVGIHALVAVGIFLGRVLRFNSWDLLHSPGEVTGALPMLATRFPLLVMSFTVVVLVVLTAAARPALRACVDRSRRTGRSIGHRDPGNARIGIA